LNGKTSQIKLNGSGRRNSSWINLKDGYNCFKDGSQSNVINKSRTSLRLYKFRVEGKFKLIQTLKNHCKVL